MARTRTEFDGRERIYRQARKSMMGHGRVARLTSVGLRGLALASRFVLLLLLARYLPPDDMGLYGLLAASVGYALFIVGFDFYTYTTRELIRHDRSEWGRLIKSQSGLNAVLYLASAPLLLLVFAVGILPLSLAPWFAPLLIVEHVSQELNRIFVASSELVTASVILFLRFGVWSFAVAGLMLAEPTSRSLSVVLAFWLAGGLSACAFGLWKMNRCDLGGWRQPVDWGWVKRGLKVAAPLLFATLAMRGLFTFDRYWVEAMSGLDVLGAYVLFIGIAGALLAILDAGVFAFLYPRLIAAATSGDGEKFRRGMRSSLAQTIILAVLFSAIALVVIEPTLIWIDRALYLDYQFMFPWILLAVLLNALGMVPHYGLYAQGFDAPIIKSHVVGLAVFVTFTLTGGLFFINEAAVLFGLCNAFGVVSIWKLWAYLKLTPASHRFVGAN